ncbi:sulfotransferase domain-containing protein [Chloroflexota bacterium]
MEITQTAKRVVNRHGIGFLLWRGSGRIIRRLTANLRQLPDFIIIGTQRGGTTSLYNYLIEHPNVIPPFIKETHFFDNHFDKGANWYRAFFPLSAYTSYLQRAHQSEFVTGEATPYYLFYPHAPKRIKATCPWVKLIIVLRNPIDRAYSHYHHEVRLGVENLTFEEALERERQELPSETERISTDEGYQSFSHQNYSYLSRGIYINQLEFWNNYFPKEQFLVLRSEDLFSNPRTTLERTTEFLGMKNLESIKFDVHNALPYQKIKESTQRTLLDYFEPYNQKLYRYLGMNLGWEN